MTDKKIVHVLILLSVMFLSLIGYLTYIELFQREDLVNSPYNQRQWDDENGTVRGKILDRNGVLLAKSEDGERIYPHGRLYAHVIGYNSRTYGRINIESSYNDALLGRNGLTSIMGNSKAENGFDVRLTIDHSLQEEAYNALGHNNGCVIATNPQTGEILAMVSKPDFDPNDDALTADWQSLAIDEDSPFVARATSGLYAPGSTFKMITALAATENGLDGMVFEDEGSVEIGGSVFENQKSKAYGKIDVSRGFAVSSNVVFCTLGARLGGLKLQNVAERFGFNKDFDFDIPIAESTFPKDETNQEKSAALAIGQGDIMSTPMQMMLVTCGIANGGTVMKPRLVSDILNSDGDVLEKKRPTVLYNAADKYDTQKITEMMVQTVESGTGTNAAIRGISVAGKTGTAENELTVLHEGKEHTWFVGFAPADDPQIAVVVMMENSGGTGGGNCAPIARNIMYKYLSAAK